MVGKLVSFPFGIPYPHLVRCHVAQPSWWDGTLSTYGSPGNGPSISWCQVSHQFSWWKSMNVRVQHPQDPQVELVGGFNPWEKCWSNWIISPSRDENKNIFETTTKLKYDHQKFIPMAPPFRPPVSSPQWPQEFPFLSCFLFCICQGVTKCRRHWWRIHPFRCSLGSSPS